MITTFSALRTLNNLPPFNWLASSIERQRKRNQDRLSIAQLRGLDDRMLKDMGLQRGEILGIVNGQIGIAD